MRAALERALAECDELGNSADTSNDRSSHGSASVRKNPAGTRLTATIGSLRRLVMSTALKRTQIECCGRSRISVHLPPAPMTPRMPVPGTDHSRWRRASDSAAASSSFCRYAATRSRASASEHATSSMFLRASASITSAASPGTRASARAASFSASMFANPATRRIATAHTVRALASVDMVCRCALAARMAANAGESRYEGGSCATNEASSTPKQSDRKTRCVSTTSM